MLLPDEHSSVVDRFCHSRLEHKGLETTLKEILDSKCQDIIELVLAFIQKTIPVHPPKQGLSLKNSSWILFIKRQKHPGIVSDSAQCILNTP